jgi:hypothetical protein
VPIDKYHDALLTPKETAPHLQLPPSTLSYWLTDQAAGEALVHRVPPARRGWPSVSGRTPNGRADHAITALADQEKR